MTSRFALPLIAAALVLAACSDNDPTYSPTGPTGRMRVVFASPDTANAKAALVRVDGQAFDIALGYGAATVYGVAYTGGRAVVVKNAADTSKIVATGTVTVADNTDHTALALGGAAATSLVTLTDDNTAPPADSTRIRVIHASPSTGNVDVYISTTAGENIALRNPDATNVALRAASAYFKRRAADSVIVRLTATGTKAPVLAERRARFATGQVRSIILLDKAGGGTPATTGVLTDR